MENLLILTNSVGGLYNFRKEVIEAFLNNGFQVYISIPEYEERAKYFETKGCHIVKTQLDRRGVNPFVDLKLMLAYRRLLRRVRPLAVLTYTIKPNIYGGIAAQLTRTPQLANVTGLGDAVENGGWLHKLSVFLYRIGVKKAKCVFFQNSTNKEQCERLGIASSNSILLPGSGVNLSHHTLKPYPKDQGVIRFLYIGRMLKDKGIEEYLETAKIIKRAYPNVEFQVLGRVEGNYQMTINDLESQGIVNYLGVTSDVRPFIEKVECTVMPSYHEGMSNVNLESAANGRPVITTNIPGCKETVDDGITGFLVKPRDVDSLVRKVETFINLPHDEKAKMGVAARKKVEREFDRNMVINAYLKEINALKKYV